MGTKVRFWIEVVRGSYWFVPGLLTLLAVLLSALMIWLDTRISAEAVQRFGWLVYTGGADGARGVLESISGSMITVAGVVFSITIVALTLASSQFGPRVLDNFMRDDGNKVVLGVFISTYLYSLLVLRAIRNGDETSAEVVPHLSVTMGLLLALASLGVLIYFIHHVAIGIQAPYLVSRIADDLHGSIEHLFPNQVGTGAGVQIPATPSGASEAIAANETGYLDAVDLNQLVELAVRHDVVIALEHRPGQFVARHATLARIWPADRGDETLAAAIRDACVIGPRRTLVQDVEFSLDQLVEIAVRALSPGINDPFTAVNAIDHLSAALAHLADREMPAPVRLDDEGEVRVLVVRPLTFDGLVDAALNQVRQNAAYHVAVYLRLLEVLATTILSVRSEARVAPLLRHAESITRAGLEGVPDPHDQDEIKERHRRVLDAARRRAGLPLRATA